MSHPGGILASPRGKSLISIGFYRVFQLTVSFCSSHQGPHGLRGGLAVVGSRKCLFFQRFPMGRKGWLLGAHLGTKCHPGFLWWRNAVFQWFYKVFCLTVSFLGGCFFGRPGNACFPRFLERFWQGCFFWPFAVNSLTNACSFHVI